MTAEALPQPVANKCGLRFERSEAKKLRDIRDRAKSADLMAEVELYEKAAEATERGEPLIVHFDEIEEVAAMVGMFVLFGIKQPTIEELNG